MRTTQQPQDQKRMTIAEIRKNAEDGLKSIEQAILQLLEKNPNGMRNSEIAETLGIRKLESDRDYTTWGILKRMEEAKQIKQNADKKYTKSQ